MITEISTLFKSFVIYLKKIIRSYDVEKFHSTIYSVEMASQLERFREGLKTIEENHADYFSSTPLLHREHKPNQLRFHYSTYFNGKVYGFGILYDSDLKADIISECMVLFAQIFKSKSK